MNIVNAHFNNLTQLIRRENLTHTIPYFQNISTTLRKHDLSKDFLKEVTDETLLVAVGVTCVIIIMWLLMSIIFWLFGKAGKQLDHILLVGPEEVGKTRAFLHLTNNNNFQLTCTSLAENVSGGVKLGKKVFTLVDIPGNGRIVWPIFDKYKTACARIFFLVDSCAVFKEQKAQTGEYLFTILTDPIIAKLKPIITIICTKQDQPMAKSVTLVKQVLEAEITTLKKTSQATLSDISDSRDSAGRNKRSANLTEGKSGNIDLSLLPFKVQFVESSLEKQENGHACLTLDKNLIK